MTRINVGVRAKELPNKLLIAEHRELKRIPNFVAKKRPLLNEHDVTVNFTLGEGHVKFFYDKMMYLYERYQELYDECIQRGLKVKDYTTAFAYVPMEYWNDYVETIHDRNLIVNRIEDRGFKLLVKVLVRQFKGYGFKVKDTQKSKDLNLKVGDIYENYGHGVVCLLENRGEEICGFSDTDVFEPVKKYSTSILYQPQLI